MRELLSQVRRDSIIVQACEGYELTVTVSLSITGGSPAWWSLSARTTHITCFPGVRPLIVCEVPPDMYMALGIADTIGEAEVIGEAEAMGDAVGEAIGDGDVPVVIDESWIMAPAVGGVAGSTSTWK